MRRSGLLIVSGLLLAAATAWGGSRVPQGVSPGDRRVVSLIEARCPTFSWSGVEKARGYELVVYEMKEASLMATEAPEEEEKAPLYGVTVSGSAVSWTPSMDRCLAAGGRYVWFVRAVGVGNGKWSEAMVFEVDSRPSIVEVEQALRVLRRYAKAEEALWEAESKAEVGPLRNRPGRRQSIAAEKGSARGGSHAEAAAPTLGTASLTVDEQIHLAAASSVFKDGSVFLWSDADANTALGTEALSSNTVGGNNTAIGAHALSSNTTGGVNTASGSFALYYNTTGAINTATGSGALFFNTTGRANTAIGNDALFYNSTGSFNTATGVGALSYNTIGYNNTATGHNALFYNSAGTWNTAIGNKALYNNTIGDYNTAIGPKAGYNSTTGNDNIFIDHLGLAGDAQTIRIGSVQYRTFIAGIRGVTTGVDNAIPVMIDSDGQLGTISSSRRFKEDIRDMGETSSRLLDLRPVAFRYKENPASSEEAERSVRYGLIAEEVAEIFPELVVYSSDGQPETVLYHLLSSMLLNELQRQHRELEEVKRWLVRPEIAALCRGPDE